MVGTLLYSLFAAWNWAAVGAPPALFLTRSEEDRQPLNLGWTAARRPFHCIQACEQFVLVPFGTMHWLSIGVHMGFEAAVLKNP